MASTSHSPQASAWGSTCALKLGNRFNGFLNRLKTSVFATHQKPLKRFRAFEIAPNPRLKLGENEKLDSVLSKLSFGEGSVAGVFCLKLSSCLGNFVDLRVP